MTRYGLVIEVNRCIGCNVCMNACKDEYVGNDYPGYTKAQPETLYTYYKGLPSEPEADVADFSLTHGHNWMDVMEVEQGKFPGVRVKFVPTPCMHCDNAPCIAASMGGAVYKRADGIVVIDPEAATGQSQIVDACPYGVIYLNSYETLPQKCAMCAHLIDEGKNPKCVDACPLNVFRFGDLDDPTSEVSQLVASGKAKPLHPEWGTQPKVFYVGAPTPTVAGHLRDNSTKLDVVDATVTVTNLRTGDTVLAESDLAGNFYVDDLQEKALYMVRVEAPGYYPRLRVAYVTGDGFAHLGRMKLFPR